MKKLKRLAAGMLAALIALSGSFSVIDKNALPTNAYTYDENSGWMTREMNGGDLEYGKYGTMHSIMINDAGNASDSLSLMFEGMDMSAYRTYRLTFSVNPSASGYLYSHIDSPRQTDPHWISNGLLSHLIKDTDGV